MKRIGYTGQLWWSKTLTVNRCDLLPDTQTRCILTTVISLLKSKKHVDWLGKHPYPLQHPCEGKELVHSSISGMKATLLLFDPRFNYRPYPLLQYPGVDLTREAEEYDLPAIGTHLLMSLKVRDHRVQTEEEKTKEE